MSDTPTPTAALATAVKWMRWWINERDCDCEGTHTCGLQARVRELAAAEAALDALAAQRAPGAAGVYAERNALVAALSKHYPASVERHPETEPWEPDWRWIVFVDLPTGQASWHIHDSGLSLFDHLPRLAGRAWDGHTTEVKYERLAALGPSPAPVQTVEPNAARRCADDFAQYIAAHEVVLHEEEIRTLAGMIEAAPTTPAPAAGPGAGVEVTDAELAAIGAAVVLAEAYHDYRVAQEQHGTAGPGPLREPWAAVEAAFVAYRAARRPAPRGEG